MADEIEDYWGYVRWLTTDPDEEDPTVEVHVVLARVIMDLKARVEALEAERDRQSAKEAWAGKAKVSKAAREFAEGIDREPEGRP